MRMKTVKIVRGPKVFHSNIRAARASISRLFNRLVSMIFVTSLGIRNGRPTRKNSDVTWCYNHRAGLTLFGSTAATAPNKLLDTPVGGFLHRLDAGA
jgi:hypothetical protein